MTSWAAVSNSEILETIKAFDILDKENSKVKSKNDPVWKDICSLWDNKMKPVSLYFYVHHNRNNILNEYKSTRKVIASTDTKKNLIYLTDTESADTSDSDSSYSQYDIYEQYKNHPAQDKKLCFDITISNKQWSDIRPSQKVSKRGETYYSLQRDWTHTFADLIFENQKLPCPFTFKSHKISDVDGNSKRIQFHGFCKECRAGIYGEGFSQCANEKNCDITFKIFTLDTRNIPHFKKRQCAGVRRAAFKEELKHKKASLFKSELIKRYQIYGDQIPPIIPSDEVIKKIRQEAKDEELGITGSLWESFEFLKENVEFRRAIRQIGYNKFFLFYWTPEQVDVYNDLLKLGPIVSIDATGSIVCKIIRPGNYSSGHIFLYQIITYIENLIVPVCQFLSERQDMRIIEFWLKDWFASGARIPPEVVTDMSITLQNAICLATNKMNYKQYLSLCYLFLIGRTEDLPKTYLRIDIAHLMNWASRLKCLSRAKSAVKDFYLRCIGLISTTEQFEHFEKATKSIFSVCQNEKNCTDDIHWLLQKIETFKFDDTVEYKEIKKKNPCSTNSGDCTEHIQCNVECGKTEIFDEDTESNSNDLNAYDVSNYIDNIAQKMCFENDCNDTVNFKDSHLYHLPEIVKDLKRLFYQFPSWTNVMRKHYKSENTVATSARSENYFRYIKDNILDEHQSCRCDKFFVKHVKSIDSKVIQARAAYDQIQMLNRIHQQKQKPHKKKDNADLGIQKINKLQEEKLYQEEIQIFNLKENWRNKASSNDTYQDYCNNNLTDNALLQVQESVEFSKLLDSEPLFNSTPNSLDNIAFIKNSESNFSIVLEPETFAHETRKPNLNQSVREQQFHTNVKVNDTISDQIVKKRIGVTQHSEEKRGKYVTPCPEVKIIHQKPKGKILCKQIIKNGNLLPARSIFGKKITFRNTCPFDSLAEVVTSAFCNVQRFKDFVQSQSKLSNCFFTSVIINAQCGPNASFYKQRASILYSIYPPTNNMIDCRDNVLNLFRKLMINYDTSFEIIRCNNSMCNAFQSVKLPIINVGAKIIWEKGIGSLEESVAEAVRERAVYCQTCTKISARKVVQLGPYLCIDTEHFYEKSMISELNGNHQEYSSSNLSDVPIILKIHDKNYVLCGAVEFIPPLMLQGLGHYVAYIRSVTNTWKKMDDLFKEPKYFSSATSLPDIKISILFYVCL